MHDQRFEQITKKHYITTFNSYKTRWSTCLCYGSAQNQSLSSPAQSHQNMASHGWFGCEPFEGQDRQWSPVKPGRQNVSRNSLVTHGKIDLKELCAHRWRILDNLHNAAPKLLREQVVYALRELGQGSNLWLLVEESPAAHRVKETLEIGHTNISSCHSPNTLKNSTYHKVNQLLWTVLQKVKPDPILFSLGLDSNWGVMAASTIQTRIYIECNVLVKGRHRFQSVGSKVWVETRKSTS